MRGKSLEGYAPAITMRTTAPRACWRNRCKSRRVRTQGAIGPLYCYTGIQFPKPECALSSGQVERRLTAILAADVAGYSRLMGADEEGTLAHLKSFRKTLVDPSIVEHRGRIGQTTGDGM